MAGLEITLTLTPAEARAARAVGTGDTVAAAVTQHVRDWLAPTVAQMDDTERREVGHAYAKADKGTRAKVRTALGLSD